MANRIDIKANMLEWAITRAGYSVQDFCEKNPDVSLWLEGKRKPTVKQLEKFSRKMHVPFGYLFLKTPPVEKSPIPFFRGGANSGRLDLNTYDTVLIVQRRQEWLAEYLSDNDFDKIDYVGSMRGCTCVDDITSKVRQLLGLDDTWAFDMKDSAQAVRHLEEILGELGVIVEFNGVVGTNNNRPINVSECRGFALVNEMAPFIFVNNADSKNAQMFTLIHEFVHLLLGVSSGYGGDEGINDDEAERLCDKVAANFLVPEGALKANWNGIEKTARKFKVSEPVIARRAKDTGLITSEELKSFYAAYAARIVGKRSGKGDFYATSRKRINYAFAVHIRNAVNTDQLSLVEAYRLTDLYGKTYSTVMSRL